jgi:hypothetical protein
MSLFILTNYPPYFLIAINNSFIGSFSDLFKKVMFIGLYRQTLFGVVFYWLQIESYVMEK